MKKLLWCIKNPVMTLMFAVAIAGSYWSVFKDWVKSKF
jgi:hypothetical protein